MDPPLPPKTSPSPTHAPLLPNLAAACNSLAYTLCSTPSLESDFAWFCESRMLQFLVTVLLPFILLMVRVWVRV